MNKLQNNEDFLELDIKDLTTIVTWKKQHVAEDPFKAIVQWVNHNQSQRKNLFGSLFCQLQLTSVTHDALTRISEESLVKENLQCSNKLVKAFAQLKYPQCQHKFLLMGGYDSETDCVAFDVITKTSKYLPKLNFPRCAATTVKVGSRVYIVGGADNQGEGHPYQSCELLDLNDLENGWKPMSNMLEPRKWCRSGTCREKIYVTGGYDHQCLSSCEEFDIQNSKWMSISNMRQARYVHATVVLNDMVYCIGGVNNTTFHFSSCECYDVRSGKWNVIAPRNEARSGLASVVLDGKIYAIGGRDDGKRISTVETYIPEANKWLFVESLHLARSCPSACVLAGKIFVIGGWHGSSRLNSVEIFDPTTEDWSFSFKTKKPVYAATVAAI
uniref:Kelch-like protein 12 n=1 Tax=Phallusia mammillata TaxID=59560 RepID=A0A6F9DGT4_9ASCI|nr:kelch-like protein 12 [Phallusia mammillata]